MDDPIKIILKYKNDNQRTHYNIYIFIGDVPKKVHKVLLEIQNLNLYDCFVKLSNEDLLTLTKFYGDFWYKKIFNTYHINNIIDLISKNKNQETEVTKVRGKQWYEQHIKAYLLVERRILYNYGSIIKDDLLRKEYKKRRLVLMAEKDVIDFTEGKKTTIDTFTGSSDETKSQITESSIADSEKVFDVLSKYNKNDMEGGKKNKKKSSDKLITGIYSKMAKYNDKMIQFTSEGDMEVEHNNENAGMNGENDEEDFEYINAIEEEVGEIDNEEIKKYDDLLEDDEIENSTMLNEMEEDLELNEIEKLYQDTDVVEDVNASKTSLLIKKALDDDNVFKKVKKVTNDFDESKNNLMFDDVLKNVYSKNYVTSQYIFKDDTIKNIKNKICVSIKNSVKFGEDSYIIPSRQYLWSEYIFDNKIEKIMIGQKWIRKSELLHIDVELNNNIRHYEELRGNLKMLRDNLKRYGSKIKREDDDFGILCDYDLYYTNNEIFMLDIYNDLGKDYSPNAESLKNITDVYRALYFPRIRSDDIKHIIEYLNGSNPKIEQTKMLNIYETALNDLVIENEIIKFVENLKPEAKASKMFKKPFVTHSVIHINLKTTEELTSSINLYRIFSKFEINEKYPFIQYQTPDRRIIFKYSEKYMSEISKDKQNLYLLGKWFENAPYGISFKMKIEDKNGVKYNPINLNDMGRVEYKIQWKEENQATIEDIYDTYSYVKELIKKINVENNKVHFNIPYDEEFKYAFLNTIQQFELPGKYEIKHNDLSEFARLFFPYVAVVIEPRKRISKVNTSDAGKYGTYLRYKRVSKYENQLKIEQKILYFIRNYEYIQQVLVDELIKQFNISAERANEEIDKVKSKYPNIKKSRNVLKKLDTYGKHKPPGIGVDIQGKQRDRYKIRISGVRNTEQLDRIIAFYEVLMYMYVHTYLYKDQKYRDFKDKLEKLTSIAKRRNKVDDIIDYEKEEKQIKQMEQVDKSRIGFTPDKGQNQWSRSCQNSGDLIRQPTQHVKLDDLLNLGFKYNDKNKTFEKKITTKGDAKKNLIIRAVDLNLYDEDGNKSNTIYYSCNPNVNGENVHIGFLSKSANPSGQCMPCCFKKDPLLSINKEKVEHFKNCTTIHDTKQEKVSKVVGDKLYILQDTNKIPEGRLGFLPPYLNYYFNKLLNKNKRMRQNILVTCETGYYFKYGVNQESQKFLNAISTVLDVPMNEIMDLIVNKLDNDKTDTLFTALNNGDLKTSFVTRDKYISYIQNSSDLSFDVINHIISIQYNINIIIFKKEEITIKVELEKEKKQDDFFIVCQNPEEINNVLNPKKHTAILIKENNVYYPIVHVTKMNDINKNFDILKKFKYSTEPNNTINHIYDFYKRNCISRSIAKDIQLNSKEINEILVKLNVKDYLPQFQFVDLRNKCKYIITNNGAIIGTKISGSIYNLRITKTINDKLLTLTDTIEKLNKINDLSKGELKTKPVGVYFNFKNKDNITCIGIMTETENLVPIQTIILTSNDLKKMNLKAEYKQSFDYVDNELIKENKGTIVDDRIYLVNRDKYDNESYELFRLHLSEYLGGAEHERLKNKIIKTVNDKHLKKTEKRNKIKELLFKEIDRHLFDLHTEVQTGGSIRKIVHPINKLPNLVDYEIKNEREVCENYNKDKCGEMTHCHWAHDTCNLGLVREMIVIFINKVSEELVIGGHKMKEILKINNFYVDDIVDYTIFEQIPGQKIINSSNRGINKILEDIFDKDSVPIVGKKRFKKMDVVNIQELNEQHALYDMGQSWTQEIIGENMTILRAFANGYMWLKYKYYDMDSRNLGYYSNSQTDLANYFMSNILDWLIDYDNQKLMRTELSTDSYSTNPNFIKDFINKISRGINTTTNGIIEYYILNKIHHIPIIIYDNYDNVLYIIDDKLVFDHNKDKDITDAKFGKYVKTELLKNYINIKYVKMSNNEIPFSVQIVYHK